LEHLIEHGDIFLHDFTNLLDRVDKFTGVLTKEVNNSATLVSPGFSKIINSRTNTKLS
jgi:hypothetical protein